MCSQCSVEVVFLARLVGYVCCYVYCVLPLGVRWRVCGGALFAVVGGLFGRRSVEDFIRKGSGIVFGFVVNVFGLCVRVCGTSNG